MKLAGAYISEEKHQALTALAKTNHRTLADQIRFLYDQALSGHIKIKPKRGTTIRKGERV